VGAGLIATGRTKDHSGECSGESGASADARESARWSGQARAYPCGRLGYDDRVDLPGSTAQDPSSMAMAQGNDGALDLESEVRDAPTRFALPTKNSPAAITASHRARSLAHSLNVRLTALHAVALIDFGAALGGGRTNSEGTNWRHQGEGFKRLALGGTGLSARDLAVLYTALGNGAKRAVTL